MWAELRERLAYGTSEGCTQSQATAQSAMAVSLSHVVSLAKATTKVRRMRARRVTTCPRPCDAASRVLAVGERSK
jgi:hypothetical protein